MKFIPHINPEHLRPGDRVSVNMRVVDGLKEGSIVVQPDQYMPCVSVSPHHVIGLLSRDFTIGEVVDVSLPAIGPNERRPARVLASTNGYLWVQWIENDDGYPDAPFSIRADRVMVDWTEPSA